MAIVISPDEKPTRESGPDQDVVVENFIAEQPPKIIFTKKHLLVAGAIFLVFSVGGASAGYYFQHKNNQRQEQEQSEQAFEDTIKFEATQRRVQELRGKRDYDQALEVADSYIKSGINNDQISFLLIEVGAIHEIKGDPTAALVAYHRAESLATVEVTGITRGIARASFKLGDKNTALEYYKKTLGILQASNTPGNDMSIDSVQRIIDGIEGTE